MTQVLYFLEIYFLKIKLDLRILFHKFSKYIWTFKKKTISDYPYHVVLFKPSHIRRFAWRHISKIVIKTVQLETWKGNWMIKIKG